MTVALAPTSAAKKRSRLLPLALAVAGVVALAGGAIYYGKTKSNSSSGIVAGQLFTVAPMNLDIKILKDGELQAIDNIDVMSRVEGRAAITSLVREGTQVKKGDTLIELDSSTIRQNLDDGVLELQKAQATLDNAVRVRDIQVSTNATDLETAQVALRLAEIDLKKYTEGTYPQSLATMKTNVEMTELTLKSLKEELTQAKGLYSRGFVTGADIKKAEKSVVEAEINRRAADTDLKVLQDYTYEREMANLKNTLLQAQNKVTRTKAQGALTLAQKQTDVDSAQQQLVIRERKVEHLNEQLGFSKILAPADGMVVYNVAQGRDEQGIAEGVEVRERQVVIRLPDISSMKAVVRINESAVSQVYEDMWASVKIAGVPEPIGGRVTKISVLADSSNRWWNPDLKEYPVDIKLDRVPANIKPGVTVSAELFLDSIQNTLAIPTTAVYSVGRKAFVFVPDATAKSGYAPREVKLGRMNSTHVALQEGVQAGDQVLMLGAGQGRSLLQEAGIELPNEAGRGPTTNPTQRRPNAAPGAPTPGTSTVTPAVDPATGQPRQRRQRQGGEGAAPPVSDPKLAPPAPSK